MSIRSPHADRKQLNGKLAVSEIVRVFLKQQKRAQTTREIARVLAARHGINPSTIIGCLSRLKSYGNAKRVPKTVYVWELTPKGRYPEITLERALLDQHMLGQISTAELTTELSDV